MGFDHVKGIGLLQSKSPADRVQELLADGAKKGVYRNKADFSRPII